MVGICRILLKRNAVWGVCKVDEPTREIKRPLPLPIWRFIVPRYRLAMSMPAISGVTWFVEPVSTSHVLEYDGTDG